jgi:hypothetical protein
MSIEVERALRALAEADAQVEASLELEARVRQAFRRKKAVRRVKQAAWVFAAAAAVVMAIIATRQPRPAVIVKKAPDVSVPAPEQFVSVLKPAKLAGTRKRQREIVTEFFPLIDNPPPLDRGELLRLTVPAETMRAVGLPVAEDRLSDPVQAEVLVSEEGFATAIRFVKFE